MRRAYWTLSDAAIAGFAVQGPVILLGNPQDNPLIDFLHKQQFLPYAPAAAKFPGPSRGMFAWQRDGIGPGQESITLIAYDEAGSGPPLVLLHAALAQNTKKIVDTLDEQSAGLIAQQE